MALSSGPRRRRPGMRRTFPALAPGPMVRALWLDVETPPTLTTRRSNPEIAVLQLGLGDQLLRRPAPYGASTLDDGVAIADPREMPDILVDHQNRLPARLQQRQAIPDLLADQRRQPLGGLVQDQ